MRVYWQGILADLADGQDVIIQQAGTPDAVVIPYEDYRKEFSRSSVPYLNGCWTR